MSFQLHFGAWYCQEMLRSPGKHNCRCQVLDCRMVAHGFVHLKDHIRGLTIEVTGLDHSIADWG